MDFHNMPLPDKDAFEAVCKELENGGFLNLRMVGMVFGPAFWEILVLCLVDARQAAFEMEEMRKAHKDA